MDEDEASMSATDSQRAAELEAALQELAEVTLNDPADDAWLKGYVRAKLGAVSSDDAEGDLP